MQILFADFVEGPNDTAFQDRPETFDGFVYGPQHRRINPPDDRLAVGEAADGPDGPSGGRLARGRRLGVVRQAH